MICLSRYARKVRESGRLITDRDVAFVLKAGFSEEQLFELTAAAALGAGLLRVRAGRRAVADCVEILPYAT